MNLAEKVKVDVPLEIVGESPAVEKKIGLLLTPVSQIEVEALPADLPEKVEIDVSKLENVGDEIKVRDLAVDKTKVEILTDEDLVVVQIGELVTKEMEEVEAEIEAEQAEAVVEAAPAVEGEAAEEGKETEAAEGAEEAATTGTTETKTGDTEQKPEEKS